MGSFSIFHWLVVLAVVMILFGAGKLPSVMSDVAKGIKAFRAGLKDESDSMGTPPASVPTPAVAPPHQTVNAPGQTVDTRPVGAAPPHVG
ncbi:MAG: twin-arginine translocase TatA/TatE family subunit [Rhodospirillaceae bacterium]